jgi:hypothetical protein
MIGPKFRRRDGTAVDKATIEAFGHGFHGQVLLPGDAGYASARRIWNASIDKHPGLIARCSGVVDVVRSVKFARANNLLVAVKGGGHNVAGRALCDDGIVIDLSAMNGVSVDPELRTVRVQGGSAAGRGRSRNPSAWLGRPVRRRLENRHCRLDAWRRRRMAGA